MQKENDCTSLLQVKQYKTSNLLSNFLGFFKLNSEAVEKKTLVGCVDSAVKGLWRITVVFLICTTASGM